MQCATHAAEFLAAACASWSAVHEVRQRRPVTGRFGSAIPVDQNHAAVPGRGAQYQLASNIVVVGNNGTDKAAVAAARELDRLIQVCVREYRAHRTESFYRMYGGCRQGAFAMEQRGHEKRTFLNVGIDQLDQL